MQWQDEGIILSVSRHGENGAILEALTRSHGRARGYVKAGNSKRMRPLLQPGNLLTLTWRSRLEDSLGGYTIDVLEARAGLILTAPKKLAAMNALLAIAATTLAEGDPQPSMFDAVSAVQRLIAEDDDLTSLGAALVRFEIGLLTQMGYGLDLSSCAATGTADNLVYVSPKSGRAVSAAAGAPYRNKLLPLPAFVQAGTHTGAADLDDIAAGFRLTGYFLERQIWVARKSGAPDARGRFVDMVLRARRHNGGATDA